MHMGNCNLPTKNSSQLLSYPCKILSATEIQRTTVGQSTLPEDPVVIKKQSMVQNKYVDEELRWCPVDLYHVSSDFAHAGNVHWFSQVQDFLSDTHITWPERAQILNYLHAFVQKMTNKELEQKVNIQRESVIDFYCFMTFIYTMLGWGFVGYHGFWQQDELITSCKSCKN